MGSRHHKIDGTPAFDAACAAAYARDERAIADAESAPDIPRVNDIGLAEIADFLATWHTGCANPSREQLRAWADDAEFQIAEGNPAMIEIPARHSKTGAAVVLRISPAGFSV